MQCKYQQKNLFYFLYFFPHKFYINGALKPHEKKKTRCISPPFKNCPEKLTRK